MAPGGKKKNFHTARNNTSDSNVKNYKTVSCVSSERNAEKSEDAVSAYDDTESKKYSKRSINSNWNRYEEPQIDSQNNSSKGADFEVLLSYSNGSGSQLKLEDEKNWDDDILNAKDISLNFQDLINSLKCIPFHERINLTDVFDEKQIKYFKECADKWKMNLKSNCEVKEEIKYDEPPVVEVISGLEEAESSDSDIDLGKAVAIQDKTENIINSLSMNLNFKMPVEKEIENPKKMSMEVDEKPESESHDLDFLLSLNVASKVSVTEKKEEPKSSTVDDWLNSLLDD